MIRGARIWCLFLVLNNVLHFIYHYMQELLGCRLDVLNYRLTVG